ncbi:MULTISPECIES: rhombosortase [unclassified Oceanobacter]|uniref:rhombosortase n=1 Tax=unclassified Oceanobacter TaxID=2620260 RepID=UPI0026E3ABC4|nr:MULTISPECIES: rhombosortase [unclassified Oceanobacter]MDO6682408.1 rhombosortase [Oceanobacter sp. 5_MG-2023]MDP2547535.1 rhombosortase [Oceanobacter sp. 4_MG-2023]
MIKQSAFCLGAIIAVLLASVLEPVSSQWLAFDRSDIGQGQWWRLLTCHWVHLSWPHALGNVGGLVLLAVIAAGTVPNRVFVGLLLWCSGVVGLGLMLFAGDLQRYVGLSGVLHGMLMVAPFVALGYSRRMAMLFAGLVVLKVVWEQSPYYSGGAVSEMIGGRVATEAHLLGGIAGGVWLLAMAVFSPIFCRDNDHVSE